MKPLQVRSARGDNADLRLRDGGAAAPLRVLADANLGHARGDISRR